MNEQKQQKSAVPTNYDPISRTFETECAGVVCQACMSTLRVRHYVDMLARKWDTPTHGSRIRRQKQVNEKAAARALRLKGPEEDENRK